MRHEEPLSPSEFREIWNAKPVLRAVYRDYYQRMAQWIEPGFVLEVGAGSGNLRDELPDIIASDIVTSPFLDVVLDAQRLPVADATVSSIVGVDVLHHIEFPRRFLAEAHRALKPGGRIVLVEPAITPVSRVAFKLLHPEPVDMRADPLLDGDPTPDKHPFDSNQAVPTLLAGKYRQRVESELDLVVEHSEFLSLAAYPFSGGFRKWSLIPAGAVDTILALERRVESRLGRFLGFRLLLVLQRPFA